MLLYFIRHGDPIYFPDSLTELGQKQAEALVKRLSKFGFDKIYTSTSERAILTAKPTCEALGMDYTALAWCDERYSAEEFMGYNSKNERFFINNCDNYKKILVSKEVESLGFEWYNHPAFSELKCKSGTKRISGEADRFMESLGYIHSREERCYKVIRPNNDRIALFAHAGFGSVFLSSILDIPYPMFSTRFMMSHSAVTVIEFAGEEISVPRILTFSNDSHLFKGGLPTKWCNLVDL